MNRGKKILITGAGSYIGISVAEWLARANEKAGEMLYQVDTLDMRGSSWGDYDFCGYDVVLHVAGIAHRKQTKKNAHLYYEVNEILAVKTAEKAKREGVGQFIILSSMNVYGIETGYITKDTLPHPQSHYGKSKLNADTKIFSLESEAFKTAVLRPPMVYGKGCRGNYQKLREFALRCPVFPGFSNERSMIFIDHLTEFIKKVIDQELSGLFFPQDGEYINTSEMVRLIAENNRKKIRLVKLFNPFIMMGIKGNIRVFQKVFGDLKYEKCDTAGTKTFREIMKAVEGVV